MLTYALAFCNDCGSRNSQISHSSVWVCLLTLSLAHSLPSDRSTFTLTTSYATSVAARFGYFVCYNYNCECATNLAIFAMIGPRIFRFLAAKNLQPYLWAVFMFICLCHWCIVDECLIHSQLVFDVRVITEDISFHPRKQRPHQDVGCWT